MAEGKKHTFFVDENGTITINGVNKIVEIDDKTAIIDLFDKRLTVRGGGLSIVQLDRSAGTLAVQSTSLSSFVYGGTSLLKGFLH